MERDVACPGELCDTCHASSDRRSRRLAKGNRSTETHERTIERNEVPMDMDELDQLAYRQWLGRQ